MGRVARKRFLVFLLSTLVMVGLAGQALWSPQASAASSYRVYISNSGSNTVSVVDGATKTVSATISTGQFPWGEKMAVSPDGSRAYVATLNDNAVSVINAITNATIATIPVDQPVNVVINHSGSRIYVPELSRDVVAVINTQTNAFETEIPVGANPGNIVMSPDGRRIYVANFYSDSISVVDTTTNTVVDTITGSWNRPGALAITPDGTRLYVAASQYETVVIDVATHAVIATITDLSNIHIGSLIMTPDGSKIYAAEPEDNAVGVVDTATNSVIATIATPSPLHGIASPDGTEVYVANELQNGTVTVIDTATNSIVAVIPVGVNPQALAIGVNPHPACAPGTAANIRWHYSASGSSGSWSGTQGASCPGPLSMGPQAMEGDLKVTPGSTLQVGYDLTIPGNHPPGTLTIASPQVTFTTRCASGATPSAAAFTVTMPATTYTITSDAWYPSGDQSSPLVYQGSATVPDLCGGGQLRLDKGGTFTATLS